RNATYRVRVVYGRERSGIKIRLVAQNSVQIHDYLNPPREPQEFDVPAAATAGGELTLTWTADTGRGGTGRGCQVAEVFLIKNTRRTAAPFWRPPVEFADQFGAYRSPLQFDDGTQVKTAADWPRRRKEIADAWHKLMGPWPPLLEKPKVEVLSESRRDNFT